MPQDVLPDLLPGEMVERERVFLNACGIFEASPITGVHLWFDRAVMSEPFLTLLDSTTQWVFNQNAALRHAERTETRRRGQYLQLVISASYGLCHARARKSSRCAGGNCGRPARDSRSHAREGNRCQGNARDVFPGAGFGPLAAGAKNPLSGLFLAGDWTCTGWPSTMEGAVRSGYLAAEAVSAQFGAPHKFLQPDLPFEGLSKVWAKRAQASLS